MPYPKEERSQAGSRLGEGSRCFSPGISVERAKTQQGFMRSSWDKASPSVRVEVV